MTRTRLNRPGLDDYILRHYKKGLAQQIADKFNVTPEYVRNKAKRLGKTQPQKPQERSARSVPVGFSEADIIGNTAVGVLLKKGNVIRHTMRG
jgi:hypothetical protein